MIDLEIRDHLSSSCLKTLVPLNESHRDQLVAQSKEFDKAIIEKRFRKCTYTVPTATRYSSSINPGGKMTVKTNGQPQDY